MNIDKEDKVQLAINNAGIALNAMKEQTERHKKLEEKGKSPEYILIYGQGYAEGVYDTKTELQPKISGLNKELETYKKIAEKLAERAGDYGIIPKCEKCSYEDSHECIECIIDWARKEVENDN